MAARLERKITRRHDDAELGGNTGSGSWMVAGTTVQLAVELERRGESKVGSKQKMGGQHRVDMDKGTRCHTHSDHGIA